MERILARFQKTQRLSSILAPSFLSVKLGDKNRADWIPYSSKILWSTGMLRCVEPWRLQVSLLQERVVLLQGPHHVPALYLTASSATGQSNTLPQFFLRAKWLHDKARILWQYMDATMCYRQNFKILIVNNVFRFIDIDHIGWI